MPDLYLGIDTSNYKTSVAVTDSGNHAVYFRSEYLEVPEGSRGLRQSEAFFRHSNRLPSYIEEMCQSVKVSDIRAAGVSSRPRRVEGSYMPCFLAGVNAAREIASVLGIPLYEFSHQEGHAAAVIEDPDLENAGALKYRLMHRSALFHMSGGTAELLLCTPDPSGYELEIAGGTKDISAGQLIDRAGVAMGYPFPSGHYLDELASGFRSSHGPLKTELPKVRLTDGYFNLSGIETKVLRLIEDSESADYPRIAYSIFESVSTLLAECVKYAASRLTASDDSGGIIRPRVYMAGGVSASRFIRSSLEKKLRKQKDNSPEVIFGDPVLSGDNAAGTAILAGRVFNETGNCNTGK